MDTKDRMRNNRRCIIYGCNSSSLKDKELKFFRFPSPNTTDYQIWLSACKESYNQIRVLKKPLICSLHFVPEDVGGRRLNPNAFPRLRLSAPKEFAIFQDREQKIKFLSLAVEEWLIRNRSHREIDAKLLIDRAREARDLLDISHFNPDRSWLNGFNKMISSPGSRNYDVASPCGTSLSMADVIRDLRQLDEITLTSKQYTGVGNENSIEISDDDDYDDGDFSDSYADLSSKLEVSVTVDEESDFYEPSMKMPKLQSIMLDLDEEEAIDKKSKNIGTYKDALKYMKPLEDFALQKEDFRAIGLLTQLEAIFKQQT